MSGASSILEAEMTRATMMLEWIPVLDLDRVFFSNFFYVCLQTKTPVTLPIEYFEIKEKGPLHRPFALCFQDL